MSKMNIISSILVIKLEFPLFQFKNFNEPFADILPFKKWAVLLALSFVVKEKLLLICALNKINRKKIEKIFDFGFLGLIFLLFKVLTLIDLK